MHQLLGQHRRRPLAATLQVLRNLGLPMFAFMLFVQYVLQRPASDDQPNPRNSPPRCEHDSNLNNEIPIPTNGSDRYTRQISKR